MVQLTQAIIKGKTRLDKLSEVKNLNLWGQDITDVSILQHTPAVQVLSLSVNGISSLRDFMHCRELRELYLRKNNVANLNDIRFLMPLPHLKVLWLSDNPCAELPHYRQVVVANLPGLEKLDNVEVTPADRQAAQGTPLLQAATYAELQQLMEGWELDQQGEWYPAWMQYRRREDNYVFWQDKFTRCSLDIPAVEKRWTLFSSCWYLVMELKYFGTPPALRYLLFLAWRGVLSRLYEAHKALVLWQAKVDAGLAARATGGAVQGFSRAMALRRLHWRNSLLGELLYAVNVAKTGRVHLLPPMKQPLQRPTFFFLF
ncbi:hypothetical protein OEZ85_007040 [Tetradesmus obliquus]|uniref:U2A'/phosphoprotein 32 family A C-terminal domain-containing protein n=2 Tax=Tetradesmus obliquus TaxID=3088 RepID=A0ABY8TWX1_TETOB|nr:hypothetical protein OEZ85_007040 [Tetradesmus obliquus]